ncbi:MAG: hypothetical protein LBS84_03530 [Clostridiales bacterium]|jgi:hypothetical protein|nr:hypothetical protein [Clostridiales bacterium]
MKIKFLRGSIAAALLITFIFPAAQAFAAISAVPTSSTVLVDGESKTFDSYNINGFNYFKLRDIAYVLNGTSKQFAVDWDANNNAMTLRPGTIYYVTGDEMASKGTGAKSAVLSQQKVFLAGNVNQIGIEAYNIDGYNYFKLRDIGVVLDIGIGWDDAKNTISIDSAKGYVESQTVDGLDKAIADAIISNNKGLYGGGGDFVCEAHITLKTVQNGSNVTVYVMAHYEEFKKTGDVISNAGGSSMPVAITFNKDSAGNYQLAEYWIPENGNRYTPSIQNKFPKDLWDKVDTQFFAKALAAYTLKQAQAHYK